MTLSGTSEVELGRRLVAVLARGDDPQAAVEGVLCEAATALGAPLAAIWMLDEQTGQAQLRHDWADTGGLEDLRRVLRRLTFSRGVGLIGEVLAREVPVWVDDVAASPNFPRGDVVVAAGLRRALAAPLSSSDGLLGAVEFFGGDVRSPTTREIELAAMTGRQLAGYLARMRIEEQLRAAEETSASIVDAALDCVITMDHRGRVLDFNPAAEATFGHAREAVVGQPLADLIIPPDLRKAHERALATYVREKRPTILDRRLELEGLRADGTVFPVELTVSRLGRGEPPVFVGFIRDLSERRALEAEQSRLLEEAIQARAQAERARVRVAFLARMGRGLAASIDWDDVVRAVVRVAVAEVADWAVLTVAEPGGRLTLGALAHADPAQEDRLRELGHVEAGRAMHAGEPALSTGPGGEHRLIMPLRNGSSTIGALTLGRLDPFTPDDVDLIASFAGRAALQLQNARLYRERSHIAQTLQASLRPHALPEIPGAELAVRYQPVGDHNEVGGDFYDVFRSGAGVWSAIVGDVAGKGAEAAAVTALARNALRTASMLEDGPARNLALLNRAMLAQGPHGSFCTVLYVRLCPARDGGIDVRFANGGHPAPLLVRRDGTVEPVEGGRGPLVGILDDAEFEEAGLRLAPGELLVLYTDGIVEVRASEPNLGDRELRATLARHAGASVDEVVGAVERRAVELQQGRPRDDLAVLGIRAL